MSTKNCPFCGDSEVGEGSYIGEGFIECFNCGAHGPTGLSYNIQEAQWNHREIELQLSRKIEDLTIMLDRLDG